MAYPDNFADVASAIVDAGVDPEVLLQVEEHGVHSLTGTALAIQTSRLPPELSTSIRAALILAVGPDQFPTSAARPAATEAPLPKVCDGWTFRW